MSKAVPMRSRVRKISKSSVPTAYPPATAGGTDCVQVEYWVRKWDQQSQNRAWTQSVPPAVAGGYAVGTLDSSSQRHIVRGNLTVHDPKTRHLHFNNHRCQSRRCNSL